MKLALKTSKNQHQRNTNEHVLFFTCLKGNDVITNQVSDHHPVIHDQVLFWNIMMQGKERHRNEKISYNNGFGIIESDQKYLARLNKVAHVIAEIAERYSIKAITLCEGPINEEHINFFIKTLAQFKSLECFFEGKNYLNNIHRPENSKSSNWGLMMLAKKNYQVTSLKEMESSYATLLSKLANRFQLWQLTKNNKTNYVALAHFPFSGNESITNKDDLSDDGKNYCDNINHLLKRFEDQRFIFCSDFNFNPYLINHWKNRALDHIPHHNSILWNTHKNHSTVTVDGILLSIKEKQKYYRSRFNSGLFKQLTMEHTLNKTSSTTEIENKRANVLGCRYKIA